MDEAAGELIHRISIHALREEGDLAHGYIHNPQCDFYPRPPRGGRPDAPRTHRAGALFLSTPSARRATLNPSQ